MPLPETLGMSYSPFWIRCLGGVLFGAGVSWFNFFLLKMWMMRLGTFEKPNAFFYLAFFSRYLFLFFGTFVIVSNRWVARWPGLLGLFGMYVGLLIHEFVKLKRTGD